jgi:hypothetical protein
MTMIVGLCPLTDVSQEPKGTPALALKEGFLILPYLRHSIIARELSGTAQMIV